MPAQVSRETDRPSSRVPSAVQTGWVHTNAVAEATVVYRRLGVQNAKCAANSTPASTITAI